jgi:CHAD domain-containing protein/CYTH domain-containing protein
MQTHVEIETKYDVADGTPLPDLIGVGGVHAMVAQAEMVLTATYYDTPDLALAAARTTLRRRTGGADDGWHLKLSLPGGDRLELRRALGRSSRPPAALTDLVRAHVRGAPLEAVATLVNRRTVHQLLGADGGLLAELSDDSVTGERHDRPTAPVVWRELEVELVDGDRELLAAVDAAVRSGGIRPASGPSKLARVLDGSTPGRPATFRRRTPVGEVLAHGLRQATYDVAAADPLVRLDRAGALARFGAALRGLAATLALADRLLPGSVGDGLDDEVRWLTGEAARLETADAARERIRDQLTREPAALVLGPVVRRVDRELAAERREALAGLRSALAGTRYLALLDRLAALPPAVAAVDGAEARVRDVLPARVERDVRRVLRALRDLPADGAGDDPRVANALRAVDRARVAETLAGQTKGWGRGGLPEVLEDAAALLVELQHADATQHWLRELAVRAQAAQENAFTFGRLHGLEQLSAAETLRALAKVRKRIERVDQD